MKNQNILSYIKNSGATHCQYISLNHIAPDEKIRGYCYENICGCYDKHLTCPPNTGSIEDIKMKLSGFKTGILVQYSEGIDVPNDKVGLRKAKLKLHDIILNAEKYLQEELGIRQPDIWGMTGGNCSLCDECAGFAGEKCRNPENARVSMESLGADVVGLLKTLNLDADFHNDKITWTGAVLIKSEGL